MGYWSNYQYETVFQLHNDTLCCQPINIFHKEWANQIVFGPIKATGKSDKIKE